MQAFYLTAVEKAALAKPLLAFARIKIQNSVQYNEYRVTVVNFTI